MSPTRSLFHRGLLYLLLGLVLPWTTASAESNNSDTEEALPELIVLLAAPGASGESQTPEALVAAVNEKAPLSGAFAQARPESARPVLSERAQGEQRARLLAAPNTPRARLERYVVLRYPTGTDLEAAAITLRTDPRVLHVERNREVRLHIAPSDPLFPQTGDPTNHQWGLHLMNLPAAWDRVKGNAYLGVVDTGLDVDHEDLRAFPSHVVEGDECSYQPGTFEGGNFRPHLSKDTGDDDCNVDENTAPTGNSPLEGHGTHVAGILAATTNNGSTGIAGHCWNCPIMMAKAREDDGSFLLDDIVEGLNYLIDKGTQSVSMSFGYPAICPNDGFNGCFCDAIELAAERDVVLTASDGNDRTDIEFPASDPRVIAVGGVQSAGGIWNEETIDTFLCPCDRPGFNSSVCTNTPTFECGTNFQVTAGSAAQDVVAPARTIVSTFPAGSTWNGDLGCSDAALAPAGDGYGLCTGTSMAAPAVSAIVGLIRSVNPLLTRDRVKSILVDHASMAGSGNPVFGNGIPDAAASADGALGVASGTVLKNRLTPLFNLWSYNARTHFSTTIPQQIQAALHDDEVSFVSKGNSVPGYSSYPDPPHCVIGPCPDHSPRGYVAIFSTYTEPYQGAPELVPLYRMSFDEDLDESNPLNRSYFYTTETAEVQSFKSVGYRLDGIEGYIYKRCSPEPGCIPSGATRLYRLYNFDLDDYVIFPESRLAEFQGQGYVGQSGLDDWIGYAYELDDSDGDYLIDGFEGLIGTNPADFDSDDDGLGDGAEIVDFPYSDPLIGPNQPPTCQDDHLTAIQDTPRGILFSELVGNDSDPDGDILTPAYDSVTAEGGTNQQVGHIVSFEYTPPPGFFGEDSFSYTATDQTSSSQPCTVTIDVHPLTISDSFSTNGTLHGRTTDVGDKQWTARPGAWMFGGRVTDSPAIGGVPFNAQAQGATVVSVAAEVKASGADWVGIGFSSAPIGPYWVFSDIWILLLPDDTYEAFALGSQLNAGTIPGAAVNGFHHVDVRYDTGANTATVLINGTAVVSSQTLASTPDIQYAGFHMHKAAEFGGQIDNFQVTSAGNVVISDSFTGNGVLNGRTAENGGVQWNTRDGAVISGGVLLDSAAIGGFPFEPSALPDTPTVTLSAEVDPFASDWAAVGFARAADQAYWSYGEFWVLVRPNGLYSIWVAGSQLSSGTIPGTAVNGYHHVELSYDTGVNTITVLLNGTAVVSSQSVPSMPDIRYAGFHMHTSGGGKIDNFGVVVQP